MATGEALVRSLESGAAAYHVKSDAHEILLWEAAVVAARVVQLRTGATPSPALATSVIASAWSHDLALREPALLARVAHFHRAFDDARASSDAIAPG
ncbi:MULTISPECIES: DUF3105 domain-containing protein [Luteimonas]|uniref:DUF3105 domain-containing protein n=1 Tax=Luteimonas TaxID=83614 RepID=UPI00117F612A|nr:MULTISPECIES: DUF3105 domain-containing protein [Luteimonas]